MVLRTRVTREALRDHLPDDGGALEGNEEERWTGRLRTEVPPQHGGWRQAGHELCQQDAETPQDIRRNGTGEGKGERGEDRMNLTLTRTRRTGYLP